MEQPKIHFIAKAQKSLKPKSLKPKAFFLFDERLSFESQNIKLKL
jgi:hypothetical protein